jgi:hypothetical protein
MGGPSVGQARLQDGRFSGPEPDDHDLVRLPDADAGAHAEANAEADAVANCGADAEADLGSHPDANGWSHACSNIYATDVARWSKPNSQARPHAASPVSSRDARRPL